MYAAVMILKIETKNRNVGVSCWACKYECEGW